MYSSPDPQVLPNVMAVIIELGRLGVDSPEPGWSQIVLGVIHAMASVDTRIVAVFTAKWEELHILPA